MKTKEIRRIIKEFSIVIDEFNFIEVNSGYINTTFLIELLNSNQKYILQSINTKVFPDVDSLMSNVVLISEYIGDKLNSELISSNYINFNYIPTKSGKYYFYTETGEYWRLLDYVEHKPVNSKNLTNNIVAEAGRVLGEFHKLTADIDVSNIVEIIPGFHRIDLRHKKFQSISLTGNERYEETEAFYNKVLSFEYLIDEFKEILDKDEIPIKIAHNDPKLSNVLFDKNGKALTLIDLDTVMPGFLNNDFGDAMRTMTNTSDENEKNIANVGFNFDFFKSYTKAYLAVMKDIISIKEKEYLALFALLITYEQTIRFYGDYLDYDKYYKIEYSTHNLQRAKVQFRLLEQMATKYELMQEFVMSV